ncbi:NERD domain-containing protein [Halobacillus salinarum]|uniref:NERD domain-containing protein n=1 Tax=Halobacillus salinarum TaxID=2932257 RepID=A0ABY4ENR4_9BACI|nr:NERD domain-containing protein [Halobacillus salinarum]UOQ46105.1 NERD domain-containing protein [Halobacillus salinarum]
MAQLIKLSDYISRYEVNIYQYPSKFIRLKQENWKKMKGLWEHGRSLDEPSQKDNTPLSIWKKISGRKEELEKDLDIREELPENLSDLKQYFLDGLFPFQLKWASTTLMQKSFLHKSYHQDEILKFFLQRFPDSYLIMYKPVVEMKNAKMDAEVILIGPASIEIIHYLSLPLAGKVHPSSEKMWKVEERGNMSKILSPLLSLHRSETYVRSVLNQYHIDFPYHKVVLAPELTFEEVQEPFNTSFIDESRYSEWLYGKRKPASPLKHEQLKAAEVLLQHSMTTAVKRPEWEEEEDSTDE